MKLFRARYLVSAEAPPLENGALLVRQGIIQATGAAAELERRYPQAERVDFAEAVIVPLLVNAHTHLELTDFPKWAADAGRADDPGNFVDWIINLIKVKIKLDKTCYHRSVANGLEQSLRSGTGVIGDILSHHSAREAYLGNAINGVLFLETLGQKADVIARIKQDLNSALVNRQVGMVELGLSPHSPYTISSGYLQQIYGRCRREGLRCSTHIAESPDEVEFIEQGRGAIASIFYPFVGWENHVPPGRRMMPVEYLQQQGGLFPENLLVHGVQLREKEIALLAAEKMSLALCPRSNARLKVGRAPASELLKAGVNLCLGTDSLASCDSLSIWDEMAFAHRWFEGQLDAPSLFRMATLAGAQALGLDHCSGSLKRGKKRVFRSCNLRRRLLHTNFSTILSPRTVLRTLFRCIIMERRSCRV